jgi:uncharacterized protein (DUF1800 family)
MTAAQRIAIAGASLALAATSAIAAPGLSVSDLNLVNRVSWGVSTSEAADVSRLGTERWLRAQLHPSDETLPPAAAAQIQALTLSQQPLDALVRQMEAQNQAANALTDPDQKKAAQQAYQQAMNDLARQAATRSLLRDLYAPDQLKEQLTWFWMNHFNVHQAKANVRAMIGDYEESAIRPHALGRFRDLLEATLKHPAMLRYLDNADNAAGHINENYARELMELHTMGVGSGYTQKDVQELARILTGVGIDAKPDAPKLKPDHAADLIRSGLFEFNPNRHDYGDKVFLGHTIKGAGFSEVEQALDILCRQPATARHVSRQLAQYFVADDPPPALVEAMAQTFTRTDGDIAAVLDTMFHAPAFRQSLGTKFKDPIHYAVSAVRLAYDDRVVLNTAPIQGWLGRMSEGLYNHETPDGYPMTTADWDGPGQMALRFEIAHQIGAGSAGLFKPPTPDAADQPAFPQLQNALYYDALAGTLSPATDTALGKAVSAEDWNVLFLASPEFMRR